MFVTVLASKVYFEYIACLCRYCMHFVDGEGGRGREGARAYGARRDAAAPKAALSGLEALVQPLVSRLPRPRNFPARRRGRPTCCSCWRWCTGTRSRRHGPTYSTSPSSCKPSWIRRLSSSSRPAWPPLQPSWPQVPLPSRIACCTPILRPRFARRSRLTRLGTGAGSQRGGLRRRPALCG